jgi:hypothetical protein
MRAENVFPKEEMLTTMHEKYLHTSSDYVLVSVMVSNFTYIST